MDLEIHGARQAAQISTDRVQKARRTESRENAKDVARKLAAQAEQASRKRTTRQYLDEILDYTQFFNKRLKFSVNEELDQVVVKVIDAQTDKVIKEIPPEVLQRLHVRIREAIGLLIDESI